MLRALLIAVTLLPIACDKPSEGPAIVAGATAGAVVDVAGVVTATRGDAKRTLAKGDAVSADDVIATSAGASVTIVLAHNNARWTLASNKSSRVSEASAWGLAKAEGSAGAVAGDTSAAGRHNERQSADTAGSVPSGEMAAAREERDEQAKATTTTPTTTPTGGTPQQAEEAAKRAAQEAAARAEAQLRQASDDAARAAAKAALEKAKREQKDRALNRRPDDDGHATKPDPIRPIPCSPSDPLCDRSPPKEDPPPPEPTTEDLARGIFLGDKALRSCAKSAKVTIACNAKACSIATTTVDATAKACIAKRVTVLSASVPAGKYDVVLEF